MPALTNCPVGSDSGWPSPGPWRPPPPEVIFADEPTGALDEHNGQIVVDLLRSLADGGTTVLMVTHDPDIAAAADRTLVLRDGVIEGEMAGTR